jgi:hypothetical protein
MKLTTEQNETHTSPISYISTVINASEHPGGSADQHSIGNSVQQPVPKNFGDAPAGKSKPPSPSRNLISPRSSPTDC